MLAIYAPEVPPGRGGVADQTLALARALCALGEPPLVLTMHGDPARFAPATCVTGVTPREAPAAAAAHGARRLLLQYVPFLYARTGVAPRLLTLPHRCREAGVMLELLVHEAFVPLTRPAWLLTGPAQRWQLRVLARAAHRVWTPVPGFAAHVRRWAGERVPVTVVPVGASLPVAPPSDRGPARARLGLADGDVAIGVFSPGASGFLHDWIAAAAASLAGDARVRWVLFGSGSEAATALVSDTRRIILGELAAEDAAATMRAMDLAAQPYVDGLTLRRTGAMLAIATGVPVVSSTGPLHDPTAGALAECETTRTAFAARVALLARDRHARAAAATRTAGYAATASVEALAARLLDTAPAVHQGAVTA